jgi:hypothetical protein
MPFLLKLVFDAFYADLNLISHARIKDEVTFSVERSPQQSVSEMSIQIGKKFGSAI